MNGASAPDAALRPHHVGCAVRDLETAAASYTGGLGLRRRSRVFEVASQQVRVCFLELGAGLYLELVAPQPGNDRLAGYLRSGFYHLCFLVPDLEPARARLAAKRYFALPPFSSEAFAGRRCQFFAGPQGHLLELCEMDPEAFARFFAAHAEVGG